MRRVQFVCDGCSETKLVEIEKGMPSDWAHVTVSLDGFKNCYPSLFHLNGEKAYDLCASCQKTLVAGASPKQWPRKAPEAA